MDSEVFQMMECNMHKHEYALTYLWMGHETKHKIHKHSMHNSIFLVHLYCGCHLSRMVSDLLVSHDCSKVYDFEAKTDFQEMTLPNAAAH